MSGRVLRAASEQGRGPRGGSPVRYRLRMTLPASEGVPVPAPLPDEPEWSQKVRNVARDPRVAINIVDPDHSRRYFAVRGRVVAATTEGGAHNIDEISGKYLGRPYPNFSGRPETRMILTIEADSVRGMGAR